MQAIVYERYGPPAVLQLRELDRPPVGEGEVLVRVRGASVNPLDWHAMRGAPYVMRLDAGLRTPKSPRLGADLAGVVEAVGPGVAQFRPGDAVFGLWKGTFAEYVCVPERVLAPMPANLSFAEAAAIPVAACTAVQALRDKGQLQPGQHVLINGASGGVGTFAVQIARALGATVTGVCSTRNVELVRSLGAESVIDYTQQEFTRGEGRYDLLLDCVANKPLRACLRVLKPGGTYVGVGMAPGDWVGPLAHLAKMGLLGRFAPQRLTAMMARGRTDDLLLMCELIEAGKVKPVIDRQYLLREVPQAISYLETGRARGKVVIILDEDKQG